MDEPTPAQRVAKARVELAATLDAIEDKLNLPKRARLATRRAKASYEQNPLPWIAGAVGAAAVLAGAIALYVRSRR